MNQDKIIENKIYPIVYRTSKGWRIFFFVLMPPFIGLMTWMMVYSFVGNDIKGLGIRIILFLVGFGLDVFLTYTIYSVAKYRVEVFSSKIVEMGVFKKKEIALEEIAGFRILPAEYINQVQFIPKGNGKKRNIPLMMNDSNGFLQWLNSSIKNLDAEEYEKEILTNEELGMTEEQRVYSLERAKKFASFLDILSIASFCWVFFWPQPYKIAILSMIILPIAVAFSAKLFPGLIRLDGPEKGVYPTIAVPFIMPSVALSLRALLDWNILAWLNFWAPFAVISISLFFLLITFFKEERKKYGQAILILIFCAVYGYGATISLNCINDNSIPIRYLAEVTEKHVLKDKSTSYYLKLSPWGTIKDAKDVDVSKGLYNAIGIKDSVSVYVKNGAMKIPWFFVRK
jgi:hypothetical protein